MPASAALLTLVGYLASLCLSFPTWKMGLAIEHMHLKKSLWGLNVLICIMYLQQDQELSKYSVSIGCFHNYCYYIFTKSEGTEPHCILLNVLWGIQMDTWRHGHHPKWMCNPKCGIVLYRYLLSPQCSTGGGPTCFEPTLTESSFGLILRWRWEIKHGFIIEIWPKGYENVEGREIANGWGRWKISTKDTRLR